MHGRKTSLINLISFNVLAANIALLSLTESVSFTSQPNTPQTCCTLSILPACCNLVNKLHQTCQFHQVATGWLKSGLLQLVTGRFETICSKPVE